MSGELGGQRRNIGRPVQLFGWLRAFVGPGSCCSAISFISLICFTFLLVGAPTGCSAAASGMLGDLIFSSFFFKQKEMSIWLIPPQGGRHQEFKFVYLWP